MDCETGDPLQVPSLPDIPVFEPELTTGGPDITIPPQRGLKGKGTSIGVFVVVGVVIVAGMTTIYVCVRVRRAGHRLDDGANGDRITVTVGVDGQRLVQTGSMTPLATSTVQSR